MKSIITLFAAILFVTAFSSCKKEKMPEPSTTTIVNNTTTVVVVNGDTTGITTTTTTTNTGGGGTNTGGGGCSICGSFWLLNASLLGTTSSSWISDAPVVAVAKTANCWQAQNQTTQLNLSYDTWADLHNYAIMNYSYALVVVVTGKTYDGYDAVAVYRNISNSTQVCE